MNGKSVTVLHYRRRAEELARLGDFGIDMDCMELLQLANASTGDGNVQLCPNAAGLLYVHAGIALADAMLVYLRGKRSTAKDHKEAVKMLTKCCGHENLQTDGIKHFQWLVKRKDYFSYDDKHVSLEDAKEAQTRIQRLLTWAYGTFPEIASDD